MSRFSSIIKESLKTTNLKMVRIKKDPIQCTDDMSSIANATSYEGYILEEKEDGRIIAYVQDTIMSLGPEEYELLSTDNRYILESSNIYPAIGFFPGGFKPPTGFHYKALQAILGNEPDDKNRMLLKGDPATEVHVIIGHSPRGSKDQNEELKQLKGDIKKIEKRGGYTGDEKSIWSLKRRSGSDTETSVSEIRSQLEDLSNTMIDTVASKNIWDLYTKGQSNVNVEISKDVSPVKGMEIKLRELDPEDFKKPIYLYAGAEDTARFQYYTSDTFKEELIKLGKADRLQHIHIEICRLARLGSATDVRDIIRGIAIGDQTMDSLSKYIPDHINAEDFYNHLNQFTHASNQ